MDSKRKVYTHSHTQEEDHALQQMGEFETRLGTHTDTRRQTQKKG